MSQEQAAQAAEDSVKVAGKSLLLDLAKDGGAVDLEVDALAAGLGDSYGPVLGGMLKPFIKQILQTIAGKL